jgi:carbon storage regulator
MLVLTRKPGESIVNGGDITIKITAVQGSRVRVGVSAPPDVAVDRAEVHRRLRAWDGPACGGRDRTAEGLAV